MAIAGMTPGSSPLGSLDRRASLLREAAGDDASRPGGTSVAASATAAPDRARATGPADVVSLSAEGPTITERLQKVLDALREAGSRAGEPTAEEANTLSSKRSELRELIAELRARVPLKVDPSMFVTPTASGTPDAATATWFKKRHELVTTLRPTLDGSLESRIAWSKAMRELEPMPATAWRA